MPFFMFYLTSYTLYLLSEIFEVATNLKFFVGYVCYSLFLYLARPGVNFRLNSKVNVSPKGMKLNKVTLEIQPNAYYMHEQLKENTYSFSSFACCSPSILHFLTFLSVDERNGRDVRFSSYFLSNTGEVLFLYVSRRLIFSIHNRDLILPWIAFGDHVPSRWTVWQCIREELEMCPKGHKQM